MLQRKWYHLLREARYIKNTNGTARYIKSILTCSECNLTAFSGNVSTLQHNATRVCDTTVAPAKFAAARLCHLIFCRRGGGGGGGKRGTYCFMRHVLAIHCIANLATHTSYLAVGEPHRLNSVEPTEFSWSFSPIFPYVFNA